jgi:DNA helicase II / ATP-dependent DNA helicase PcrA
LRPDDPEIDARLLDFIVHYDVETWRRDVEVIGFAKVVIARSAEMTSLVDFDDMLWLPVIHSTRFPNVDYLFIDECQDLNPVQHSLAISLSGSGRTVIVGDPYQAIYGWRGADCDSIPKLRDRLRAKVMPLTVTWRCPRSHIELARQLVPDIEARPDAPEGILVHSTREIVEEAVPGDMVLCRANAPIVSACLRAISRRTPAYVRGRAIGDSLMAVVNKIERDYSLATIADFVRGLVTWRNREVARLEAKDGTDDLIEAVIDKADCLDAVASSCVAPSEIPAVIGSLFADSSPSSRITFSSVHRAKGSEASNVTYIQIPYSESRDRDRPPQPWEIQQRKNLRYVALTRSQDTLILTDN